MSKAEKETPENQAPGEKVSKPSVVWDDRHMRTTYANVCNVSSTREEMTLLFGTNQTWHTGQQRVTVQLSDRIILSPYAAKRLSLLLHRVVEDYESRFGPLETGGKDAGGEPH